MSAAISNSSSNSGGTFSEGNDTYEYDGHYCCDSCGNFPILVMPLPVPISVCIVRLLMFALVVCPFVEKLEQ